MAELTNLVGDPNKKQTLENLPNRNTTAATPTNLIGSVTEQHNVAKQTALNNAQNAATGQATTTATPNTASLPSMKTADEMRASAKQVPQDQVAQLVNRQQTATAPASTATTTPRATSQELYGSGAGMTSSTMQRMNYVDTTEMERNLKKINDAAAEQAKNQIDNATRTSADQLRLQEREAAAQYAEQQKQISAEERQALDNSALYAEARGDRGGVGQAQYNAVQANAAKNRANVQAAQTKMSSDVNRQIGDLRRQGEYQKAEALLTLSQQYLSQINQLKQWAAEMNMSVDQVNLSIAQWEKEFEQAEANITGVYKGQKTLAAEQFDWQKANADIQNALTAAGLTGEYNGQKTIAAQTLEHNKAVDTANLTGTMADGTKTVEGQKLEHNQKMDTADLGKQKLDAGIMPSADQLAAMNMTEEEASNYIAVQKAAQDLKNDLAIAEVTGNYGDQRTVAGQNADTSRANSEANIKATNADLGFSTLEMGGVPSADQLQDMGWTVTQARTYLDTQKAKEEAEANADNLSTTEKRGWTKLDAGILPSADELKAMNLTADAATNYISAAKAEASASSNRQAQAALADNGWTALDAGIMPSAAQLSAMGITSSAAQGYIDAMNTSKADNAAASAKSDLSAQGWKALNAGLVPSDAQLDAMGVKKSDVQALLSSLNSSSTTTSETSTTGATEDYDGLFAAAAKSTSPENYIASHYKEYGFTSSTGLMDAFEDYEPVEESTSGGASTKPKEAQGVSIGVTDPKTGKFINRTDTSVASVTTDNNGNTVYRMKDGRVLYDYSTGATYSTQNANWAKGLVSK